MKAAGIYLKQRQNLAQIGLVNNIYEAAIKIDLGRKGFAYHIAFISHRTRIQNILRTPGVDPIAL